MGINGSVYLFIMAYDEVDSFRLLSSRVYRQHASLVHFNDWNLGVNGSD